MKTRYEKTKTPETKFLNVYIKEEFSRESSISHDRFVAKTLYTRRFELYYSILNIVASVKLAVPKIVATICLGRKGAF